MNRRIPALRLASALVAVLGMVGLVAVWRVGPARADTPVDQITGNGDTESAVTVSWAGGLVGADNKTVVAPRDDTSPFAFMYPDFKNLSVRVSQTQNLVHQSINVTWTGGKETQQPFRSDFLQMMECYGDANAGPTPEQCEYGSFGLLGSSPSNQGIGGRGGTICVSHTPSTTDPPGGVGGTGPGIGCDPREPSDPSHLDPAASNQDNYSVPFIPVGLSEKVYGYSTEFYDRFNSNEVQTANTRPDGTGQVFFQTLTATQAPGLGCGLREAGGQPRDCWLVIVPRGEVEPNGYTINNTALDARGFMNESPLGAASWAQRIQIHLGFDPLQPNCPIGSAKERGTVGSELVAHAVFSWQLALNSAAGCKTLFGFAATPEPTDTSQLADPAGAGLAFTTVPIGSEAVRGGSRPPTLPPLLYAPMTVSAVGFGFNVNEADGFRNTPIKLTPRLVAKALTQSYRFDLPDVDQNHAGPDWAAKNPNFITNDPEFTKLNPGVVTPPSSAPLAPLLTEDRSGVNQQVWAWVRADPVARQWLGGMPDENGMVVNPHYQALGLDKAPLDSFPRADPTCFDTGHGTADRPSVRCSLDLLPYLNNYDDAGSHVRAANNPLGAAWDLSAVAPDGKVGWWGRGGVEAAGQTLLWGVMDTGTLANYGLVPADLCDASGAHCVSPNVDSVTTALDSADFAGAQLPSVDPANPGPGGYPLVQIGYAAVRLNQDAEALRDYGTLIAYAAGQGQTAGVEPGQLPRGYLPLPAKWRAVSQGVAAFLARSASPTPVATTATPNGPTGGGGGGGGGSNNPPAGVGLPAAGATPVTASTSPAPFSTTQVSAEPAAQTTQPTPAGAARWVLIVVVVAGLAGAVGGPLLRLGFGGRAGPWRQP
jgi:hypothetical protein